MGKLQNAMGLRNDPQINSIIETAVAIVAREVIVEAASTPNHDVRLKLASEVAATPPSITALMTVAVTCEPGVATQFSTAASIPEDTVLNIVRQSWTTIANLRYPNG